MSQTIEKPRAHLCYDGWLPKIIPGRAPASGVVNPNKVLGHYKVDEIPAGANSILCPHAEHSIRNPACFVAFEGLVYEVVERCQVCNPAKSLDDREVQAFKQDRAEAAQERLAYKDD